MYLFGLGGTSLAAAGVGEPSGCVNGLEGYYFLC